MAADCISIEVAALVLIKDQKKTYTACRMMRLFNFLSGIASDNIVIYCNDLFPE